MNLISICIPVLNEEENILNTFTAIDEYFKKELKEYKYEIILHISKANNIILIFVLFNFLNIFLSNLGFFLNGSL